MNPFKGGTFTKSSRDCLSQYFSLSNRTRTLNSAFFNKNQITARITFVKKKKIKETRKSTKLLDGTPYNARCISPIISKSLTMQVQHPVRKAFPSSSTNEDRVFSRDERENFSLRVSPLRRVAPLSQKKGEVPRLDYEHRHGWS